MRNANRIRPSPTGPNKQTSIVKILQVVHRHEYRRFSRQRSQCRPALLHFVRKKQKSGTPHSPRTAVPRQATARPTRTPGSSVAIAEPPAAAPRPRQQEPSRVVFLRQSKVKNPATTPEDSTSPVCPPPHPPLPHFPAFAPSQSSGLKDNLSRPVSELLLLPQKAQARWKTE